MDGPSLDPQAPDDPFDGPGTGGVAVDAATLDEHAQRLRGLARALVGNGEADDLVQRTWLEALRSRTFAALGADDRGPYLRGIARRLAANERRQAARRRRREAAAARPDEQDGRGVDPSATTEQIELLEVVLRGLKELPEPYRTTLRLRFLEQLSAAQIGERTDSTEGAVRVRVHRGLALLRERLDERHGGRRSQWYLPLAEFAGLRGRLAGATAALPLGLIARFGALVLVLGVPAALLMTTSRAPIDGAAPTPGDDRFDDLRATIRAPHTAPPTLERELLARPAEPTAVATAAPSIAAVLMPGRTPLPGARVRLREPDGTPAQPFDHDALTDATGRAWFPDASLEVPRFELEVTYPDHGRVVGNVSPTIAAAGELTVELWPLSTYAGRVVDGDGAPVAGAILDLRSRWSRNGRSRFVHGPEQLRVTTDTAGRFALDGVVDGPLPPRIAVLHPEFEEREDVQLDRLPDLRAALMAGHGELVVTRAPVPVTLRVVDPLGTSVEGARLAPARPEGRMEAWSTVTDADGLATVGLAVGDVLSVIVSADGLAPRQVLVTGAERLATVQLERAERFAGRVVDRDGAPIADATIQVIGLPPSLPDGRVLAEVGSAEEAALRLSQVDADAERLAALGPFADLDRAPERFAWAPLEALAIVATDADGRFAWPGAPGGAILVRVGAAGFAPRARLPLAVASDVEITLEPLRYVPVTVAVPGLTGAPPETRYTARFGRRLDDGTIEAAGRIGGIVALDGRGRVPVRTDGDVVRIAVQSIGYKTVELEWESIDELIETGAAVELEAHTVGLLTVVDAAGRPAVGAEAIAVRAGAGVALDGGRIADGTAVARSDEAGSVSLERPPVRTTLVVVHPSGIAMIGGDWGLVRDVTLSPWATLEIDAGPERAGWTVALDARRAGRSAVGDEPEGVGGYAPTGLRVARSATLDGAGRAVLEHVPPVQLELGVRGPDDPALEPRLLLPSPGERIQLDWP